MKKYIIPLLVLLAVSLTMNSCKKDYGKVGDWPSKAAGIKGTWKATKVVQVDYAAKDKGADIYMKNVSDVYSLTDFIITFDNQNFTISGTGHNFAKLSTGTWSFDAEDFPSKINLTDNTVSDAFSLVAPPKEGFDEFIISYDRYVSGKKTVGYEYYLKKQ